MKSRGSSVAGAVGWLVVASCATPVSAREPAATAPATADAFDPSDIGYPSPAAALAALRAKPGAVVREQADWVVVEERDAMTLWSFTTPGMPAHPAAVKRRIFEVDGRVAVQMHIRCDGPRPACDQLSTEFEQLNRAMSADLQRQGAGRQ